ncbi:CerR family C-terminal domain-containing protein [Oceanobacter mangrovi]|uniref:CerR family C-terminal domain-containing protein n=1 Tax=Oceanobacter mangrovi TaxID=2862510 RepID=UPI001C8D6DE9|nr:CerR family C-terminal domain-containing protein [Oceanobacter mangrovi]
MIDSNDKTNSPAESGRGRSRSDGDQTRQRILQAAGDLFGKQGFSATTNKSVAESAGVDLASINYHFGSRNGLYQAVLVEAHRSIVSLDFLQQLQQSPASPEQKLAGLVRFLARVVTARQSWNVRVLVREILVPSIDLRALVDAEITPKIVIVRQLLAAIAGLDVNDPRLATAMIQLAGPCLMLLVVDERLPLPVGEVRQQPPEQVAEQMLCFLIAGLKGLASTA